eukprot:713726-Amphidinium_carterae.1
MHQTAHHHYGLSASSIKQGSVVLQMLISDQFLQEQSRAAVNGYSHSLMLTSLPFDAFIITGCCYIQESLAVYLNSPA